VPQTPSACPSLVNLEEIREAVGKVATIVREFAQCFAEETGLAPAVTGDICSFEADITKRSVSGKCALTSAQFEAAAGVSFLSGFGSRDQPGVLIARCAESESCAGGANVEYFAELGAEAGVEIAAELDGLKVKLTLSGVVTASAGLAVTAGGACRQSKELLMPKAPKPVATACFYLICVSVVMQGLGEINVDGELNG